MISALYSVRLFSESNHFGITSLLISYDVIVYLAPVFIFSMRIFERNKINSIWSDKFLNGSLGSVDDHAIIITVILK